MQEPPSDRAVTVRERDPVLQLTGKCISKMPIANGVQSEATGLELAVRIPLPHGHGSVRSDSDNHRRGKQSFFHEWGQRDLRGLRTTGMI